MDENEDKKTNEPATPSPSVPDPVGEAQALSEMRGKVDSLEAENKALLEAKRKYYDAVLNKADPDSAESLKHRPISEIRDELIRRSTDEISNLDYAKLVLEMDSALLDDGKDSCFLPHGKGVNPTADEYATAEKFHRVLQECVDEADGDPVNFNMALKKRSR